MKLNDRHKKNEIAIHRWFEVYDNLFNLNSFVNIIYLLVWYFAITYSYFINMNFM